MPRADLITVLTLYFSEWTQLDEMIAKFEYNTALIILNLLEYMQNVLLLPRDIAKECSDQRNPMFSM
jgi:hypothetical protein